MYADLTYTIEHENGKEYDIDTRIPCPGSPRNNPPLNVGFVLGEENITVSWAPSSVQYVPAGYRVGICIINQDTEECEPVSGMYGKLYRTVFDAQVPFVNGLFILDTGLPVSRANGEHKVFVSSYNLNDVESSRAYATQIYPIISPAPAPAPNAIP